MYRIHRISRCMCGFFCEVTMQWSPFLSRQKTRDGSRWSWRSLSKNSTASAFFSGVSVTGAIPSADAALSRNFHPRRATWKRLRVLSNIDLANEITSGVSVLLLETCSTITRPARIRSSSAVRAAGRPQLWRSKVPRSYCRYHFLIVSTERTRQRFATWRNVSRSPFLCFARSRNNSIAFSLTDCVWIVFPTR